MRGELMKCEFCFKVCLRTGLYYLLAMFLSLISFNVFQITTFHYFVEYGKGLTLCFIKHLDTFDISNKKNEETKIKRIMHYALKFVV